ncbi:hypothetical protein [Rhodoferax sp.]|nr:hypothetical protein [Rhodoferax sp.]
MNQPARHSPRPRIRFLLIAGASVALLRACTHDQSQQDGGWQILN